MKSNWFGELADMPLAYIDVSLQRNALFCPVLYSTLNEIQNNVPEKNERQDQYLALWGNKDMMGKKEVWYYK